MLNLNDLIRIPANDDWWSDWFRGTICKVVNVNTDKVQIQIVVCNPKYPYHIGEIYPVSDADFPHVEILSPGSNLEEFLKDDEDKSYEE